MTEGLTLQHILADLAKKKELIDKANRRITISLDYYRPRFDTAIRAWKIYRAIVDAKDDDDEPNTGPAYAFGVIEDSVAAISESTLNSRVPTPAKAKKEGQQKAAENFNAIAGTYFTSGQYQSEYPDSVRERAICGSSWEVDCWAWRYETRRRWAKVDRPMEQGGTFKATEEVTEDVPVQVGYYTRFPPFFNVFPQPRISTVEKMGWLNEIEENVLLSTMKQTRYVDPATGQQMPFFDLTEVMRDFPDGKIRPTESDQKAADHREMLREIVEGISTSSSEQQDDEAAMHLNWCHEGDRLWCVGNGSYLLAYAENIYHRPGIPYRIKKWTGQKGALMGIGMIEPVENLLYEQDDIHKLSMRNWYRIINRMIAYNPERVPYADNDFKPRAMGRIRVTGSLGESVASAIQPIDMPDVTNSMLTQESNNKGLIERALGLPDFSRGVEGTKQSHDTLGGLQMIQTVMAKRVASVRRQELASFQKQMWRMEGLYSQFLLEKQPFTVYGPDGSTALAEFDLWDIATEGAGFDFIIEYDPSFGDDALARNQLMVLLDQTFKYNAHVLQFFPPGEKPLAQPDEVMRRLLGRFGFNDTSGLLARPNGVVPPDAEMRLMLQGQPVMVNPSENMIEHYAEHVKNFNDPQLREALQRGAVPPDVLLRLKTHIEATAMAIQQARADPGQIIRAKQFQKQAQNGPQGGGMMAGMLGNRDQGMADMGPRVPGVAS